MMEIWRQILLFDPKNDSKILLKKLLNTTATKLPLSPLCLSFENDVGTRDEFTRRRVVVV